MQERNRLLQVAADSLCSVNQPLGWSQRLVAHKQAVWVRIPNFSLEFVVKLCSSIEKTEHKQKDKDSDVGLFKKRLYKSSFAKGGK